MVHALDHLLDYSGTTVLDRSNFLNDFFSPMMFHGLEDAGRLPKDGTDLQLSGGLVRGPCGSMGS